MPEAEEKKILDPQVNFFEVVKNLMSKNKSHNEQLTLAQLRYIEHGSARHIQKMVRGRFTRKWYKAYQKRKKFGVPFSGIEIIQYPFLRQFAKLNMDLHSDYNRDEIDKAAKKVTAEETSEFQRLKGNKFLILILISN